MISLIELNNNDYNKFVMLSSFNENKKLLKMNLQFFADEGAGGEKTEKPSDYRREKAREEGQVAKSIEINTALLMVGLFFALKIGADFMYKNMSKIMIKYFGLIPDADATFTISASSKTIASAFGNVLITALPMFGAAVVIAIVANVIQVGWKPTAKALKPKFARLNPIEGMKRIFSKKAFLELFKSMGKFALIAIIIYGGISDEIMSIVNLVNIGADSTVLYVGGIVVSIGIKVGLFFAIIAIIDYIFQRRELNKNLMMSKQEVKEEYKQLEGDPQIKQQRRQKQRQMSMSRMMQDVKTADVVITNPTHFAVALKYDKDTPRPPYVVAKGQDYIALKIKEEAKASHVTIYEDKPLARTLYASVEIGDNIPQELYQAVAEVLAFVYKLRGDI